MLALEQLKSLADQPTQVLIHIKEILLALASTDEEVRAWAADCLQLIEVLPETETAQVAGMLDHSSEYVVTWACKSLSKSSVIDGYQNELSQVLNGHPNIGVKQAAAAAIAMVGRAEQSTLDSLAKAAESNDPRLQRLAKEALQKRG